MNRKDLGALLAAAAIGVGTAQPANAVVIDIDRYYADITSGTVLDFSARDDTARGLQAAWIRPDNGGEARYADASTLETAAGAPVFDQGIEIRNDGSVLHQNAFGTGTIFDGNTAGPGPSAPGSLGFRGAMGVTDSGRYVGTDFGGNNISAWGGGQSIVNYGPLETGTTGVSVAVHDPTNANSLIALVYNATGVDFWDLSSGTATKVDGGSLTILGNLTNVRGANIWRNGNRTEVSLLGTDMTTGNDAIGMGAWYTDAEWNSRAVPEGDTIGYVLGGGLAALLFRRRRGSSSGNEGNGQPPTSGDGQGPTGGSYAGRAKALAGELGSAMKERYERVKASAGNALSGLGSRVQSLYQRPQYEATAPTVPRK